MMCLFVVKDQQSNEWYVFATIMKINLKTDLGCYKQILIYY